MDLKPGVGTDRWWWDLGTQTGFLRTVQADRQAPVCAYSVLCFWVVGREKEKDKRRQCVVDIPSGL